MELVTVRELKQRAAAAPEEFRVRVQVESVTPKTTRSGNPYYEVKLADAQDRVTLKAWSDSPGFETAAELKAGVFLEISGEWLDTGKFGVDARNWSVRPLDDTEVATFLAGPESLRRKQERDFDDIQGFVDGIYDPRLRGICMAFLEKFGDRFRRTAAAREYHHARRGGLVEHVAQMMRSADAIASVYPELNRDLLLTGVLFHDCGKLWENCYPEKGFAMPYFEAGELLGHIAIGMDLANKLWRELLESEEAKDWLALEPATEDVRKHLLHVIASHHGEIQFGSPVVPKTPEAMALHYVDNLDAKLEMFGEGYQTAAPVAATIQERVFPLPGRLVRPLRKFDPELAPDEAEVEATRRVESEDRGWVAGDEERDREVT